MTNLREIYEREAEDVFSGDTEPIGFKYFMKLDGTRGLCMPCIRFVLIQIRHHTEIQCIETFLGILQDTVQTLLNFSMERPKIDYMFLVCTMAHTLRILYEVYIDDCKGIHIYEHAHTQLYGGQEKKEHYTY